MEPIVSLNVGGRVFTTTRQTLSQSQMLNALLSRVELNEIQSTMDSNGNLFIDRSPELFSVVLDLLRTGRLWPHASDLLHQSAGNRKNWRRLNDIGGVVISGFLWEQILEELCFYGIPLPADLQQFGQTRSQAINREERGPQRRFQRTLTQQQLQKQQQIDDASSFNRLAFNTTPESPSGNALMMAVNAASESGILPKFSSSASASISNSHGRAATPAFASVSASAESRSYGNGSGAVANRGAGSIPQVSAPVPVPRLATGVTATMIMGGSAHERAISPPGGFVDGVGSPSHHCEGWAASVPSPASPPADMIDSFSTRALPNLRQRMAFETDLNALKGQIDRELGAEVFPVVAHFVADSGQSTALIAFRFLFVDSTYSSHSVFTSRTSDKSLAPCTLNRRGLERLVELLDGVAAHHELTCDVTYSTGAGGKDGAYIVQCAVIEISSVL